MGELKAEGRIGKILVTGCLSQRYKEEILAELPEVDGVLGTGSYSEIVSAIEEVTGGGTPCRFGSIHAPVEELDRVLTTPPYIAYLRIAEGCDNHCAYCVIPSLRGKYRSRAMENVLAEAKKLAAGGVKELIIIAQDITRYGIDLYGEKKLPALLRELCKMDFRWIRLHYLYPDEIDDELIDTIAEEPKILKYLDIPIQHCNDEVLRAMNRRNTKEELLELFYTLRGRIDGLVLRTSLITGLPFEDEAAFDELCRFLREVQIERAGVFPYSPEEGTRAAQMERVDTEEAKRRAELAVDVQSDIIDAYNESVLGDEREVLCEGFDSQSQMFFGRSYAESPDIDGRIYFTADGEVAPGTFVTVRFTGTMDGELTGEQVVD
jgi:ribosomal protein S12 methylthiotransferase